jgi:hypothetical protein
MLDHRRVIAFMALTGALITSTGARAQAPAGRYVLGSDHFPNDESSAIATVYDTETKLTWQQAASGPFTVDVQQPTNAVGACSDLTFETGVVGWRLPTLRELFTLFDFTGSHGPFAMIDEQFFPNTPAAGFLSATSSPLNPVQCLYFTGKAFPGSGFPCGSNMYARCVR